MADDDEWKEIEALPDKIRDHVSDVIRQQGQMLSDAQKAALRALEQDPAESGNLEASCVVVDGDDDLTVIVQAGGDLTTSEVRSGSGVPYDHALAFEFGTRHQPARPFFYNTYRERKPEIDAAISAAVDEALS